MICESSSYEKIKEVNGSTVQLQAEHLKGALGRKGKPCQRQKRGG